MSSSFTPVVFGVTSAANAANIKGYGIIDNSDTRLYNLFDVDISSVKTFDWKGNNDVSIQSMGNVPNGTSVVISPPSANGTYKLKCTVSSGTPTYSWVADS